METLATRFMNCAPAWRDRPALVLGEQNLSFDDWISAVERVSDCLQTDNRVGEKIGILCPSAPSFAVAFFGISHSGGTAVPLNILLHPKELSHLVDHCGMKVLLTDTPLIQKAHEIARLTQRQLEVREVSELSRCIGTSPSRAGFVQPQVDNPLAVILYTSGTTGEPKGVMLSQENLLENHESYSKVFTFSEKDHLVGVLPLFHTFAITANLLPAAFCGCCLHLVPRFQPKQVVRLIRSLPSVVFTAVPSMLGVMAGLPGETLMPSARIVVSGGAALPPSIEEAFETRFGVKILEGYGLTEAAPVLCCNTPGHNRQATVGRALPGVELQVWDNENKPLPPGERGELVARGKNIMLGYYQNETMTAETLAPGNWLRTGDIATMDEEGYVRIVGRQKELIISAGENIYPREIEDVLQSHPGVSEVAVVGVADPSRGEVPLAIVAPVEETELSPAQLRSFCRERLAEFKVPRFFDVRSHLPKTITGKIMKKALSLPIHREDT